MFYLLIYIILSSYFIYFLKSVLENINSSFDVSLEETYDEFVFSLLKF